MDREKLMALIDGDEFGLLEVKAKPPPLTEDERLEDGFQAILDFVVEHDREPAEDLTNMAEAKLAWRLKGIRSDVEQLKRLAEMDTAGLLTVSSEPPKSLAELFESDVMGLLGGEDRDTILDVSSLPAPIQPDERASGKRVVAFDAFEARFNEVQRQLRAGERKLAQFKTKGEQPRAGDFFVLRGVLCLVDEVDTETRDRHGRINGRMRVVFENGTESNYLLRAFTRKLYQAGRRVTAPLVLEGEEIEVDPDAPVGFVYVLRSLSDDPQVTAIPFLHKIGFTKQSVAQRLDKAEDAVTFLKAPVTVAAEYQMPATAAQKVEAMLHKLFAEVRVDAAFQQNGVKVGEAKEWFSVPREVIDEAIGLIGNGAITSYAYDAEARRLVLR